MATGVRKFPEDSLEKQIYNLVDSYTEYLPVANDRNRLAYSLFRYIKGDGDSPSVLVKTTKIQIQGISPEKLAEKIDSDLKNIKQ